MTTVKIWDSIRDKIEEKRNELKDKYGRKPTQMDIASSAILVGLDSVEERLGFKTQKGE